MYYEKENKALFTLNFELLFWEKDGEASIAPSS